MDKIINVPEDMIKYIISQKPMYNGLEIRFKFPNGYGIRLIRHAHSYGMELDILRPNNVPIDNQRYLTDDSLQNILTSVMKLRPYESK